MRGVRKNLLKQRKETENVIYLKLSSQRNKKKKMK